MKNLNKKLVVKLDKIKLSNVIFYLILIIYSLTASDSVGVNGSKYKYIMLIIAIFYLYFLYKKSDNLKQKKFANKDNKNLIITILVFIAYSIARMIIALNFSFRVIQEFLFWVCPIIYAYLLVSIKDMDEMRKLLKNGFVLIFILYILSLGMNFNQIVYSLKHSDFLESSSQLESGVFSGLSLAFALFFIYDDNSKIWKYLSMLFVFMTFKRLSIVTVVILYFISFFKKRNMFEISEKIILFSTCMCFCVAVIFFQILKPQNLRNFEVKYNVNMSKITMTRSDRMNALYYSDYISYGLGSSNEYMYNHFYGALEMDFIRFFIELGYIPVLSFIYTYLHLCKDNLYLFIFMFLKVFAMIFTSCLTSTFSWMIIFIVIFSIKREEKNADFCDNTGI